MNLTTPARSSEPSRPGLIRLTFLSTVLVLAGVTGSPRRAGASENVPSRPFAQMVDLPLPHQFVIGVVYEESEAYRIWAPRDNRSVKVESGGENYGIDINQGFLALQYGITERWAADLSAGATTLGWRSFSPNHSVQDTTGLMDWTFGIRYQLFTEGQDDNTWLPAVTFRAGAVLPGSFDEHIAFAPGVRSAAIVPEVLARKHFGWTGFGGYFDGAFRWNKTSGNDQYLTTIGLFQQIKGWELDVGYRHMQSISGHDISFEDPSDLSTIDYPRSVREINDSIEAGFSYTTSKRHIRYGFHTRTVVDGSNTDKKFWIGGSVDFPLGGKEKTEL